MNKNNYIQNEVTTMATCWKLKLKNNTELGFTDFIKDITIEGITYKSQSGFFSSSIESTASVSIDNLEIGGFLNSESISKEEILSGLYDNAFLDIFIVNYQDVSQVIAEVRGLSEKLTNKIGNLYSPTCRAQFGGKECKVKNTHELKCKIISVINKSQIEIDKNIDNSLYNYGVINISDAKQNQFIPIKSCNYNTINLMFALPKLKLPATCIIYSGCDKTFSTCCNVYNNGLNFRGEPHVPGIDEIHKTAGTFR